MSVTVVRCSSCQGALGVEDVNLSSGLAKCRRCDKVFQLSLGGSGTAPAKPPVPLPRGISQTVEGVDLVIEQRWFGATAIIFLLFSIAWDAFLVLAAQGELKTLLAFPHLYLGIAVNYYTVCLFFNKTVIRVNPNRIEVKAGPLPAAGNREIPAEQVDQLYCRKVVGRKGSVYYQLMVLLREGKAVTIGGASQSRDPLVYLEQQIEQALGISDRFVEGEDRPGSGPPSSFRDLIDLVTSRRKP